VRARQRYTIVALRLRMYGRVGNDLGKHSSRCAEADLIVARRSNGPRKLGAFHALAGKCWHRLGISIRSRSHLPHAMMLAISPAASRHGLLSSGKKRHRYGQAHEHGQ
jgi:hypothetical protein